MRPGLKGEGRGGEDRSACDMGPETQPRGRGLSQAPAGLGPEEEEEPWCESQSQPREWLGQRPELKAHLRLRERGRRRGERCPTSSSTTLSELRKCLDRKCSSSGVGWKGSWWRRSREDELDWQEGVIRATGSGSVPKPEPPVLFFKAQAASWSPDGNPHLPGSYASLKTKALPVCSIGSPKTTPPMAKP